MEVNASVTGDVPILPSEVNVATGRSVPRLRTRFDGDWRRFHGTAQGPLLATHGASRLVAVPAASRDLVPSAVRCNCGVGPTFWLVGTVITLVSAAAAAGADGGPWVGAVMAVGGLTVVGVLRWALPRLTIRPADQVIQTRRSLAPFAAIQRIEFDRPRKNGVWARFIGPDGQVLARFAVGETLLAPATAEQWAALREIVQVAATRGPVGPAGAGQSGAGRSGAGSWPPPPPTWQTHTAGIDFALSPAQALPILDAQIAWCQAGHRPDHRHAPMRGLLRGTVHLL